MENIEKHNQRVTVPFFLHVVCALDKGTEHLYLVYKLNKAVLSRYRLLYGGCAAVCTSGPMLNSVYFLCKCNVGKQGKQEMNR